MQSQTELMEPEELMVSSELMDEVLDIYVKHEVV